MSDAPRARSSDATRYPDSELRDFHPNAVSKTLINCRGRNVCPIIAEIPLDELPSVVRDAAQGWKETIVMTGVVVRV